MATISTKRSNDAYIIEAMLEYFITIAVSSTYLTHVMTYIGIDSSIQGIISSIVSLGYGFQLFAILFPINKSIKRNIVVLLSIGNILFSLVFFTPLLNFPFEIKVMAFILSLLPAHIIRNYVEASKISWCMSHVDDSIRGKFTANKEIVSLVGGMAFSFALGAIIDALEVSNELELAFTIIGGIILLVSAGHITSLLFVDKKRESDEVHQKVSFITLFKNKQLMKTIPLLIIFNVANYITLSYLAAYQNITLGFSPLLMTIFSVGGTLIRLPIMRPLGKIADKYSFAKMFFICAIFLLLSYITLFFTVPSNGIVMFAIYSVFSQIAAAGTSSSQINLIYDSVEEHERSSAYALSRTTAGFAGFLATLAVAPLYKFIGDNGIVIGNNFTLYPIPVMALIAIVIMALLLVYTYFAFIKKQKKA
ncbi:MAG: MFS transporter [Clostridia bacterium]|nr:MFS transporter [Clostridia bacterium]